MLDGPSYYKFIMADRKTLDVKHAGYQALAKICTGECYATEPNRNLYINNWNVNDTSIYHRHPEFKGATDLLGKPVELEWNVKSRACTLCGTRVPDTIWLINKLYMF